MEKKETQKGDKIYWIFIISISDFPLRFMILASTGCVGGLGSAHPRGVIHKWLTGRLFHCPVDGGISRSLEINIQNIIILCHQIFSVVRFRPRIMSACIQFD